MFHFHTAPINDRNADYVVHDESLLAGNIALNSFGDSSILESLSIRIFVHVCTLQTRPKSFKISRLDLLYIFICHQAWSWRLRWYSTILLSMVFRCVVHGSVRRSNELIAFFVDFNLFFGGLEWFLISCEVSSSDISFRIFRKCDVPLKEFVISSVKLQMYLINFRNPVIQIVLSEKTLTGSW